MKQGITRIVLLICMFSLLILSGMPHSVYAFGTNLLNNPGFEEAANEAWRAKYWTSGQPDSNGDSWGNYERVNWRARSGSWEAAIKGKWTGSNHDNTSWWQQKEATPGVLYKASGWFYADNGWFAINQTLSLEFYDVFNNLLDSKSVAIPLSYLYSTFRKREVSGIAPAKAHWVRFVVLVEYQAYNGTLQFDDVELIELPHKNQDFNLWTNSTADGCYALYDWKVCTGKVLEVNARSGYAAHIKNGNYIQSPLYDDGLGTINFWYRHGHSDTNSDPDEVLAFQVQKSSDGTTWTTIGSNMFVRNVEYDIYSVFVYETTPHYLRILQVGGTNELLIDDISMEEPVPIPLSQNFNGWSTYDTPDCYTYQEWQVCTGTVSESEALEGKSATLAASDEYFENYVQSPLLSNGYGTISFYYASGSGGVGPAHLELQDSPDGITWNTLDTITGIELGSYYYYSKYYYKPSQSYIRIVNITNAISGDVSVLLLNEDFNEAPTAPAGWTFSGVSKYDKEGSSGVEPNSIKFDYTGDQIITPTLDSPTNMTFWLKGYSTDDNSALEIEALIGGSWVSVTNMKPLTRKDKEAMKEIALSTNTTQLRFTYTKSAGNLAFDDLKILGVASDSDASQELLLDQIVIGDADLVRCQDFDSWPNPNKWGDHEYQGWKLKNTQVDTDRPYSGQSALLSKFLTTSSVPAKAYLSSPELPAGIGTISFVYARYSEGGTDPVYFIQTSSNNITWSNLDVITVTSTNFTEYAKYMYDTSNYYFRIWHDSGAGSHVLFDNVCVIEPTPPPNVNLSVETEPEYPYTNDTIGFMVRAIPEYSAKNLDIKLYYRIGESGDFTNIITFAQQNTYNFKGTTEIAQQPAGTIIQYYIKCSFEGPGSENTSPVYYPTNYPASTAKVQIARSEVGTIWLNEIDYTGGSGSDPQFIEFGGPRDFDFSNWSLELIFLNTNNVLELFGNYSIPSGQSFSNNVSAKYAVWVIGTGPNAYGITPIAGRDMTLTNWLDDPVIVFDGAPRPAALILRDEIGNKHIAYYYSGVSYAYQRLPLQSDSSANFGESISLIGSNTVAAMSLAITNATPGAINSGQTFVDEPGVEPEIWITGISITPTHVTLSATATNGFTPQAFYCLDLLPDPQTWISITDSSISTNGDEWQVVFVHQMGSDTNCFFKVKVTED